MAGDRERAELHRFDGDPDEVCAATCDAAIALVLQVAWGQDEVA